MHDGPIARAADYSSTISTRGLGKTYACFEIIDRIHSVVWGIQKVRNIRDRTRGGSLHILTAVEMDISFSHGHLGQNSDTTADVGNVPTERVPGAEEMAAAQIC